jgi:MerR family transcriptional regulator, light-induced transcriptional regulator
MVTQEISQVIQLKRDELATAIVDRQWELDPELNPRYGAVGHAKCVQDVKYNLSYLSEAIAASSPGLFANYIAWVKVLFAGLKIPVEDLARNLEITCDVLSQLLPAGMNMIACQYVKAGLEQLPCLPTTLPTLIDEAQPLGSLASQYLKALLRAERQTAHQLILEAVAAGTSIKDIYLHVFQRTQHEIGRLWQLNQITVAQEHYCTAATQLIMSQLYPHIFSTERNNRRLVTTCVSDELHEIGLRIVSDFFEMEGWDTFYLGANTPTRSIIQMIADHQPDLLAISATMTFHVQRVAELIAAVRSSEAGRKLKIMVGGYPFNIEPDLWRQVGADASAPDALTAVAIANQLVTT